MKPRAHIFVGSKSPLCTITDTLPQFDAYPSGVELPTIERPPPQGRHGTIVGSCLCGGVAFEITGGLAAHRALPLLVVPPQPRHAVREHAVHLARALSLGHAAGTERRAFRLPPPRTYETDFCAALRQSRCRPSCPTSTSY